MLSSIIVGFVPYYFLNSILQLVTTKKLAMNYTALFQATSACFVWLFGTPSFFIYNTGGYFLFDLYYLLRYREFNIPHTIYYYHHIASWYYMSLSPLEYNWFNVMGVGELSNIPSYIVYHYLKTDPEGESAKKWKIVQKVWFGGFRLVVASVLTYHELKDPVRFQTILPVIPLYIFGIGWAIAMIKK
tara:strand:+ start:68 stop:628 length:561 start_codon:yes stop_codon:yes gene_type:complete